MHLVWNQTLGTYTWNLPAKKTCPGSTPWCQAHCYSCKGRFNMDLVQDAHARNLRQAERPDFVSQAVMACSQRENPIRIHSSGDFYSPGYIRKWRRVAEACPDVSFYGYTKVWRKKEFMPALEELADLNNVNIWLSVDPSTEQESRPAWPQEAHIEIPEFTAPCNCRKQTHHEKCTQCGLCYSDEASRVIFKEH